MSWMELSLDTTSEAVDWICTLLASTRYEGNIKIVDYAADDSDDFSENPDSKWAFTVYFYLPDRAQSQAQAIADVLLPLSRTGIATELQMQRLEDAAIADLPKTSAPIHRIGDRFVITTGDYVPADHELTLQISPSLAFGSGLHPATQLSLQLLEKYVAPAMKTLDLGSGTGILSVAIAKLGAQVWAVDNDAIAVQATQQTVQQNGVASQVTVQQGSLGRGSELGHWMGEDLGDRFNVTESNVTESIDATPFDLIVANLLGRIHITLAPDYRRALHPGGTLIIAGFTADYEEAVIAALLEEGFEAIDYERQGEWVAWMYRLNPPAVSF